MGWCDYLLRILGGVVAPGASLPGRLIEDPGFFSVFASGATLKPTIQFQVRQSLILWCVAGSSQQHLCRTR